MAQLHNSIKIVLIHRRIVNSNRSIVTYLVQYAATAKFAFNVQRENFTFLSVNSLINDETKEELPLKSIQKHYREIEFRLRQNMFIIALKWANLNILRGI